MKRMALLIILAAGLGACATTVPGPNEKPPVRSAAAGYWFYIDAIFNEN